MMIFVAGQAFTKLVVVFACEVEIYTVSGAGAEETSH
jgi:hypothetical protein